MALAIAIVAGVIFGALCFGAGYLVAHKAKVIATIEDLAGKATDVVGSIVPK